MQHSSSIPMRAGHPPRAPQDVDAEPTGLRAYRSTLGTPGAHPAPQTSDASAAQPSLDMQTLLDDIHGSRASAEHLFDGVFTQLESRGAAIAKTIGALSSLQVAHVQLDERLAALQAHRKEASARVETLEARIAQTGTTMSVSPAPPNNEAIDDVLRRLELPEATHITTTGALCEFALRSGSPLCRGDRARPVGADPNRERRTRSHASWPDCARRTCANLQGCVVDTVARLAFRALLLDRTQEGLEDILCKGASRD